MLSPRDSAAEVAGRRWRASFIKGPAPLAPSGVFTRTTASPFIPYRVYYLIRINFFNTQLNCLYFSLIINLLGLLVILNIDIVILQRRFQALPVYILFLFKMVSNILG